MTEGYIWRCFDHLKNTNTSYVIATNYIIHKLEKAGYEAYLVGGCVRDALLFKEPKDFDITTNATTDQIKEVFNDSKIIETGIKHGTVTVVVDSFGNDIPFEITTYRIDGNYSDGRHPDNVTFTKNLKDDLSRRDFTINAMAYNPRTGLVDYFNGVHDLHHETIRCVGSPVRRFSEDGLRILRAMRFACACNFKIDKDTAYGMRVCKANLAKVSKERIHSELDKMVANPHFATVAIDFPDVLTEIIPQMENMMWCTSEYDNVDLYNDVLSSFRDIEPLFSKEAAHALLFRDLELSSSDWYPKLETLSDKTTKTAMSIMRNLKFDNNTMLAVRNIIWRSFCDVPRNKRDIRRMIHEIGRVDTENVLRMMKVHSRVKYAYSWKESDILAAISIYEEVKNETVFSVTDLKVDGNDMFEIGYRGVQIRNILNMLLDEYFSDMLPNEHDALYKAAKEHYEYRIKVPF